MLTPHVTIKRHASRKAPVAVPVVASEAEGRLATEPVPRAAQEPALDAQTRRTMIAESAYYRAEQRGFAPGGEMQDWLEAEAEVGGKFGW